MSVSKSLQAVWIGDADGNAVGILLDGGIYRVQTVGKILNAAGTQINPATQETVATLATEAKLELVRVLLATIDADTSVLAGVDYATQTTLAALASTDFATQTTLAAFKAAFDSRDLATQTTLAALLVKNGEIDTVLDTIFARLNDRTQKTQITNGTLDVGVIADNSINRLEARNTIVGQVAGAGAEVKVTVIEDTEESSEKRLQTEARLAPGSTVNIGTGIPADPANLEIAFLTNGGSENMRVNGSVTPVAFEFQPGSGIVLAVQQLLVVFTADDFSFDGASFGPNSTLTNGIKFETDIGGVVTEIFNIKQNEDFLRVPGRIPLVNNTGPKDVLGVAFNFGGLLKLTQADGDKLIVTVRDDLTSVKLKYLTATVYGAEE